VILVDHPYQYKVGVSKRPGWDRIAAVANGRVYDNGDFDIILLNRPAPRIVRSLREVSRLLHPEAWDVE
jgi:ABC-type Fe3+-hydroxamate transport system substrate-binding protein